MSKHNRTLEEHPSRSGAGVQRNSPAHPHSKNPQGALNMRIGSLRASSVSMTCTTSLPTMEERKINNCFNFMSATPFS